MKRCARTNLSNALLPIFCLFIGAGIIGLGVYACAALSFSLMLLILFAVGFGMIAMGLFCHLFLTREYTVNAHGITLRFLGRFTIPHPWERVSSIVLCDLGDNLHAALFPVVIRIAACKEKCGPFDQPRSYNLLGGMDKWRTDLYHLRRFLSIIVVDFNEDALRKIAESSGRDIPECWSNAQRKEIAYRKMNLEE